MRDLPMVRPMADLPESVTIWEMGARDGLQNESVPVSTEVKLEFIDRLARAGLPVIEATSFVRPEWVPQLADADDLMRRLHRHEDVRYPVLVPNPRGLARAVAAEVTDIGIFASATDTFARRNLNRDLAGQWDIFEPTVAGAREHGITVHGYVSMVFGDPWEGAVDPGQVVDVCRRLSDLGVQTLSLGDTIGVATPGAVTDMLQRLLAAGIPIEALGVHFHDTYGQALSNTLASLQMGITRIDASAGGLGGCPYARTATGNLATEDLVWMLDGLGIESGVDLTGLVQTSVWMADRLGRPSPSRVVTALRG